MSIQEAKFLVDTYTPDELQYIFGRLAAQYRKNDAREQLNLFSAFLNAEKMKHKKTMNSVLRWQRKLITTLQEDEIKKEHKTFFEKQREEREKKKTFFEKQRELRIKGEA